MLPSFSAHVMCARTSQTVGLVLWPSSYLPMVLWMFAQSGVRLLRSLCMVLRHISCVVCSTCWACCGCCFLLGHSMLLEVVVRLLLLLLLLLLLQRLRPRLRL
jgi:hypothetical protein